MVYWLSWHRESGIWYLSFHVPFPRHCLNFLVALGCLNRLRSCGWAWSRDSVWLCLASTVHSTAPERVSFPPGFSSLQVGSCGGWTLCAQSRICDAAQTRAAEGSGNPAHSAHLPSALQRCFAYTMNYLQGFLFYVGRSLCGPFQNS